MSTKKGSAGLVVGTDAFFAEPEKKESLIWMPPEKEEEAKAPPVQMAVYGVPPKHGPKLGGSTYRRLIRLNHPGGESTVQLGISPPVDGFNQAQITFKGNKGWGVCERVAVCICDQLRDHPGYKVD